MESLIDASLNMLGQFATAGIALLCKFIIHSMHSVALESYGSQIRL